MNALTNERRGLCARFELGSKNWIKRLSFTWIDAHMEDQNYEDITPMVERTLILLDFRNNGLETLCELYYSICGATLVKGVL